MDGDPKTTAFSDLYQLVEAGEALLARGDLDGALIKYRQAARIVPGGSQMEEQIALTIQSILRAKQAPDSGKPPMVQRVPGSDAPGLGTGPHVVTNPYQASYQPDPAQPNWGVTPTWEKQSNPSHVQPVAPTYAVPQPPGSQPYAGPGSTVAMPGPVSPYESYGPASSAPGGYTTQDPYSYAFDQAMEATNYADWARAESLLSGIVAAQPYYTRNGVAAQEALAHARSQLGQAAHPAPVKKWIIPALIGGVVALAFCALASGAGLFGYFMARTTPTPTQTTTLILAPTYPPVIEAAPTYTLPPTYTPLPTYTPEPSHTPLPEPTNTKAPPPTQRPTATEPPPAANCCTLRVYNRSSGSLWVGTSLPYGGNTLNPNWYIDFHLAGPQSVSIYYCDVRLDGSQVNCNTKTFNVSEPLEEGSVP